MALRLPRPRPATAVRRQGRGWGHRGNAPLGAAVVSVPRPGRPGLPRIARGRPLRLCPPQKRGVAAVAAPLRLRADLRLRGSEADPDFGLGTTRRISIDVAG